MRAPALPFEARQYLLRVMAPDSVLVDIAGGSDRRLAAEARLVQATRRGAAGQWTAAIAALPPGQSKRVALWTTARSLSSDTTAAGTLARARWLRQRNGALYFGSDKIWYRSLNWRLAALQSGDSAYGFSAALPWTAAAETEAIGRHLRGTYEMYHSVVAYRDWLQRPGLLAVERRRVAREADAVYRWLVDWDNNNSSFWKDTLEAEGIGRAIRDAGRR